MHRTFWRWILPLAVSWTLASPALGGDPPAQPPAKKKPAGGEPGRGKAQKPTDPNLIMLDHVDAVFSILAEHKDDCEQAVGLAVAYVEAHKKELVALRAKAEKMEKSLCPRARKKYNKKIMQRAGKMGEKYTPVMFTLYDKCPDHIDRLQQALMFLGSKCKEK